MLSPDSMSIFFIMNPLQLIMQEITIDNFIRNFTPISTTSYLYNTSHHIRLGWSIFSFILWGWKFFSILREIKLDGFIFVQRLHRSQIFFYVFFHFSFILYHSVSDWFRVWFLAMVLAPCLIRTLSPAMQELG